MGCILLCVAILVPFIAVNTTLYVFPRRLQALFSKMHTLYVSAFLLSCYNTVYTQLYNVYNIYN
jgi:hypothetical protein